MPAIDFPASPSVNDEYSFEGRTWLWNGTGWEVKSYPAALQLGSASAPSLYFTGDTNTGVYSPGADQAAITTGGTERLRITSGGNVGIGTSAPLYKLDVAGSARIGAPDTSTVGLELGTGATGDRIVFIDFVGDTTYTDYGFRILREGGANGSSVFTHRGTGSLTFTTTDVSPLVFNTSNAERMRISPTGNVGIATSSPAVPLHVAGLVRVGANDASDANLEIGAGATGNRNSYIDIVGDTTYTDYGLRIIRGNTGANTSSNIQHRGTGPLNLYCEEAGNIGFFTSNLERARIDSSGRLLVGTSTARSNFYNQTTIIPFVQYEGVASNNQRSTSQVYGNSDNAGPYYVLAKHRGTALGQYTVLAADDELGVIDFQGADGAEFVTGARIGAFVDGTPGANDMPGRLVFFTTTDGAATQTEKMRIDNAGNITFTGAGLKVTTGRSIAATADNSNITLFGGDVTTNTGANIELYGGTHATTPNLVVFDAGEHRFRSVDGATERCRIDSSGRLLVGTSSSVALLGYNSGAQFAASTGTVSLIRNTTDNGATEVVYAKSRGTIGSPTVVSNGDGLSLQRFAGYDGASYIEAARISATVDGTPGTNDMPGRLTFSTTADGAAGSTERMRITSVGNVGIGTNNPGSTLDVNGTIRGGNFHILDGATAAAGAVGFSTSNGPALEFWGSAAAGSGALIAKTGGTERARIDSSGRLLVGTSTSVNTAALGNAQVQVAGTTNETAQFAISRFSNDADRGRLTFIKSRGSSGTNTIVQADDAVGRIEFLAADGSASTAYPVAAHIGVFVDGTPGLNDMPGRIVLSTTLDGASSPTEAFRITNDRVRCYNQAAPAAVDTTATLTVANLKTGIITSSTAAAVTMTLPTGTDTEAGFSGIYTNMTFEWSVINTGATNAVTVQGGTGHTLVGSGTVAASNSGRFASRRTAANTFVTYRLSS